MASGNYISFMSIEYWDNSYGNSIFEYVSVWDKNKDYCFHANDHSLIAFSCSCKIQER